MGLSIDNPSLYMSVHEQNIVSMMGIFIGVVLSYGFQLFWTATWEIIYVSFLFLVTSMVISSSATAICTPYNYYSILKAHNAILDDKHILRCGLARLYQTEPAHVPSGRMWSASCNTPPFNLYVLYHEKSTHYKCFFLKWHLIEW